MRGWEAAFVSVHAFTTAESIMPTRIVRVVLSGLVAALACLGKASAHEIVGNRFFPATLTIDDPGVNDELAIPTVSYFTNGDAAKELDISGDYSKRITADFAVGFGETWTRLKPPWMATVSGFQNLDSGLKYESGARVRHVNRARRRVGQNRSDRSRRGELQCVHAGAFFFGKGLGDLPDTMGWARPLAVTENRIRDPWPVQDRDRRSGLGRG
jgi:hypothetical protein